MLVWHVMQQVRPGHNTSYKTGLNWVEAHDDEQEAVRRAALMNACRGDQHALLEYVTIGPLPEDDPAPTKH